MSHILGHGSQLLNELVHRLEEVQGDEPDAGVLPERPLWDASGGDDDLGPGTT